MQHIQGQQQSQVTLFPNVLDDYVAQDNPVGFLDAFVDALDLVGLAFRHAVLQETGRPPHHPGVLLKLYVYGYLNRIRSRRLLEEESHRNVEVIWLTSKLMPDHKTIAHCIATSRFALHLGPQWPSSLTTTGVPRIWIPRVKRPASQSPSGIWIRPLIPKDLAPKFNNNPAHYPDALRWESFRITATSSIADLAWISSKTSSIRKSTCFLPIFSPW